MHENSGSLPKISVGKLGRFCIGEFEDNGQLKCNAV
jgi:hypothetical protein